MVNGRRPILDELVATFQEWLYLPDPSPLYAILGTVAANRMMGDAVWLLVIGTPSCGKSELLNSIIGLADVYPASTLTEAALLSGTARRERAKDASGGLLRTIGNSGIILCKDFGSVLNMNRDARASALAALREIYDGTWTRHVGTEGGRKLHWSGKVGLLGGCTPSIDRHHAVMGVMGERFVFYRLPEADADALARRALEHSGREARMRQELAAAVSGLFATLDLKAPPAQLSEGERNHLVNLSTFVVRCRSAVERDGYNREIELLPGAEAPPRVACVLFRLMTGLSAIGLDRTVAWGVVTKVALDSIPALRWTVIEVLAHVEEPRDTTTVAQISRYPAQTTRRTLEDLTAYGVIERVTDGAGKAHKWQVSGWARMKLEAIRSFPESSDDSSRGPVPEMSGGDGEEKDISFVTTHTSTTDISGKVSARATGTETPRTAAQTWRDL